MDIVFVHRDFPGQFRFLAIMLAADESNRVVFLTGNDDPLPWNLPRVEIHHFRLHRAVSGGTHPYLRSGEEAVLAGQGVVRALASLCEKGLRPQVIITHAGGGLGLFIKDLLPKALHVAYHEWYFRPETAQVLFSSFTLDRRLSIRIRNQVILQELVDCDVAVSPTEWQRSQFPASLQGKIEVVFDGIDTDLFHPIQATMPLQLQGSEQQEPLVITPQQRVLSYATRGMEPLRGFPEFMRMLPALLQRYDDLIVLIGGRDRVVYSYPAPSHGGSWKQHLLAELGDFQGRERVVFTGGLTLADYARVLQRSDLHVYFSRPYVTSWGLFQAAASGSRLMINTGSATRGIVASGEALLVNLDDQASLEVAAADWLAEAMTRRQQERHSLLDPALELRPCLLRWRKLLQQWLTSRA